MFQIACERPWLLAHFTELQTMASWAVGRPGFVRSREVAWLEVGNEELRHATDPMTWFAGKLMQRGLGDAVGLMTARNVSRYERASRCVEDVNADCVVTLGLNNGEHVGRRVGSDPRAGGAGTINILCAVSVPLSDAALLEALSVATQARTVALIEVGYKRPGQQQIVTGTGTDCVVISAPDAENRGYFAGMHTAVGEAIGSSVYSATLKAAREWCAERGSMVFVSEPDIATS